MQHFKKGRKTKTKKKATRRKKSSGGISFSTILIAGAFYYFFLRPEDAVGKASIRYEFENNNQLKNFVKNECDSGGKKKYDFSMNGK